MNNDNNQNSMVIGNVDNSGVTNDNLNNEVIENLDNNGTTNNNVMPNSPVTNNDTQNSNGTFFSQPLNNDNNQGLVMDNNIPLTEPTPQVQTPPAYTNPQTINPTPNNFQPQGSIGMTPPVSLEPEQKPKKKTNKTLFVIIVLIALIAVGFGTYYVLNYTDLLTKKEQIVIDTNTIEINIGETLPESITEYAKITGTNISNCNLDVTKVDVNQGGTYNYTVTCGNVSNTGTVTVIDNIEVVVETKTVYKEKEASITASEFAAKSNDGLKYDFVDQSEVDNALKNKGTYTIKLKISKGVKTIESTGKLVILDYPVRGYVTCEANAQNITSISASKVVAEKFGILADNGQNSYAGFGYEITTFTFTDSTVFNTYQTEYDEKNKVTIDGVTGVTEFSTNESGQGVIKITKELDNSAVLLQYGAENMQNYSSIKKHFGKTENGLGYNCTYQKAA